MAKFLYYIPWQRRGNFTSNDDIVRLTQPIDSESGITEAKRAIAAANGLDETEIVLLNWKAIE